MSDDTTRDDPPGGPDDGLEPLGAFPQQVPAGGIEPDPAFAAYNEPAQEPPPIQAQPDPHSDWNQGADAHDLPTRESRLIALSRFAFPPEPPLDDEGEAARDRRWTSRVVLTATLFLLVFNAVSLTNWSRQQEPGWITDTVGQVGEVWSRRIAMTGADQPRETLRDAWETARTQRYVEGEEETMVGDVGFEPTTR